MSKRQAAGLFAGIPGKARRFFHHHFPRYVFIHINKTAGSSIEEALWLRFEHKTALEKRRELGRLRWNNAFRFCFVRNPWDRVLSHYLFRVKTNQTGLGDGHMGFTDWVLAAYRDRNPAYWDQPKMFQAQWDWISDESGACMVDFIGRFERLHEDFASICEKLRSDATLPHRKSTSHRAYQEYYDDASRSVVADRFAVDLERFGYTFDCA